MIVNAIDVADYILDKLGPLSAMKLQKLVYYSQAWHLVWKEEPLFSEEIQAWANGPVVPTLYDKHRGHFKLNSGFFKGCSSKIDADSKDVINRVIDFYGQKDAQWLSELTHREDPWKVARLGLDDGDRGNSIISHETMAEYYTTI